MWLSLVTRTTSIKLIPNISGVIDFANCLAPLRLVIMVVSLTHPQKM